MNRSSAKSSGGIDVGIEVPADAQEDVTPVTGVTSSSKRSAKKVDTTTSRPRKRDSAPKRRTQKKPSADEVTTAAIQDALTQLLTLPAIPCSMVGDDWAVDHFSTAGPIFAENLAKASERSPAIRKWCERLTVGESVAVLAMSGTMYFLPPMIHWGIIPMPDAARTAMGVPEPEPEAASNGSNSSNGNGATSDVNTGSLGH